MIAEKVLIGKMEPRRILHVLGTAQVSGIAICRIVESIADTVDPEKYEIEACFLRPGELTDRLQSMGIKATSVNWNGRAWDVAGAAKYAALLRSAEFSIVHLHIGGRAATGLTQLLTHARIVLNLHGRASEQTGIVSSMVNLPARDALIANSRIVAEWSRDPNAVVVYPGINAFDFPASRKAHAGVVIGTACRLELIKGLSSLVKALAIIAPEFPYLRLEIAGDGSLRSSLEQESRRLGVSDIISFLGWREDLPSVMEGWDIFVLPSLDEGFGVAALEAMAAGLPVIASAVGGLLELVQDGKTGLFFSAAKPAELAIRISEFVRDPQKRSAMGIAGRQRALHRFSTSQMVEQMIEIYDRLLD